MGDRVWTEIVSARATALLDTQETVAKQVLPSFFIIYLDQYVIIVVIIIISPGRYIREYFVLCLQVRHAPLSLVITEELAKLLMGLAHVRARMATPEIFAKQVMLGSIFLNDISTCFNCWNLYCNFYYYYPCPKYNIVLCSLSSGPSCAAISCRNGGTCRNTNGVGACSCAIGYSGNLCQTGNT